MQEININEPAVNLMSEQVREKIMKIDVLGYKVTDIDYTTGELTFRKPGGMNFRIKWEDLIYTDGSDTKSIMTVPYKQFNMSTSRELTLQLPITISEGNSIKLVLKENGKIEEVKKVGGKKSKYKLKEGPRGGKYYLKGGRKNYVK